MPKKGTGRFTHEEWKRPTDEMRKSPRRVVYLDQDVHAELDKLDEGVRSANVNAACRAWFHLPPREDSPPRPPDPKKRTSDA